MKMATSLTSEAGRVVLLRNVRTIDASLTYAFGLSSTLKRSADSSGLRPPTGCDKKQLIKMELNMNQLLVYLTANIYI